jgi:transcriptional regulator with XRE-family HTH domain
MYICVVIAVIMKPRKPFLLPSSLEILKTVGENLKLSRLRRKLSAAQVAERAGISRDTLRQIEKGSPGVAIGICCQVLFVLGMEKDLLKLAADDVLGRKLQDAELTIKERAPKRKTK